jgi:hypothetical protein
LLTLIIAAGATDYGRVKRETPALQTVLLMFWVTAKHVYSESP